MTSFKQEKLAAEAAEVLAVQALGFIAEDTERLGRFLALTGIGPADIRHAAHDRAFLLGILDYVTGDQDLLVAFAGHAGVDPATIVIAQQALAQAGGEQDG